MPRKTGVYKGRKASLDGTVREELLARLKAGEKVSALARHYGISRQTLYSYVKLAANPQPNGKQAQTA